MKQLNEKVLIEINEFCQKKTEAQVTSMYGVRDQGGLISLAASVEQSVFGIDVYPTIISKAAFLWRGITNYHCFYNGNKRTGLVTAYVFLLMNGFRLTITKQAFYDAAIAIAAGKMTDEAIEDLLAKSVEKDNRLVDVEELSDLLETIYQQDAELRTVVEELSLT